jgi:hypothetical protein
VHIIRMQSQSINWFWKTFLRNAIQYLKTCEKASIVYAKRNGYKYTYEFMHDKLNGHFIDIMSTMGKKTSGNNIQQI